MEKKILYLSNLCSPKLEEYLLDSTSLYFGQAVQKFNRLIVEGLTIHNSQELEILSSIPITYKNHRQRFWKIKKEEVNGIQYNYIPFINIPILKEINSFIYTFFRIIFWGYKIRRNNKVIICDILNLSISLAALIYSSLTKTKIIAIVTDIPGIISVSKPRKNLKTILFKKISNITISNYDSYILLTNDMDELVNPKKRPKIIMEGLVDINMNIIENPFNSKSKERILLYAGGIYKKYGVKNLLEAFLLLKGNDLRLYIYGEGDLKEDMKKYNIIDHRIIYNGIVPNKQVVESQIKATLLINPRPTNETYTKYSFPSKNMEYMVSGTPLVTTRLPGMPIEYNKFVYLFDDETIEGIAKTLEIILSKPKIELHEFGINAKTFVLNEKSNMVQSKRIIELIDKTSKIQS